MIGAWIGCHCRSDKAAIQVRHRTSNRLQDRAGRGPIGEVATQATRVKITALMELLKATAVLKKAFPDRSVPKLGGRTVIQQGNIHLLSSTEGSQTPAGPRRPGWVPSLTDKQTI